MLKAVEDKIIIQVVEAEQVSSSGLVLAMDKEIPDQGVVFDVGPGIMLGNGEMMIPEVEVGQTVIFAKYQGTDIEHDGKSYKILAYRDILAVIG